MAFRRNPNKDFEDMLWSARQARMPYEREAWLNLAFFLGEQYVEWSSEIQSIRRIKREPRNRYSPRPVVNKIMHYVRYAHHEALRDKPTGDVLPPTDDYADLSDAAVAKAWIEHAASPYVTSYDRQLSRATLWAIIAGTGYLKWIWNPAKKRVDIIPPSFFELFVDPYAREFSRARYVIHSQFMDPDQVYELYGVEVEPNKVDHADEVRTELLRGMGAAPVLEGVLVNELWMKPCRKHPQGLYVVWTGRNTLVEPQPLPYPHLIEHRMLPFTQLGCIERPDSVYYLSPVQFLRPAQMELNKFHAQLLLIRERFANPKWWIPKELELEHEPDDSPSQILSGYSHMGMLKPEVIQPTGAPHNNDGEMLEQQMMHIVGQHEVSHAQVPGRVEAARAIEMLKEADLSALATLRDTIRVSNDEGWFQALELQRKFGPEEEMVLAYSREGVPEVKRFRAGDLKPGFRVRTTMSSGLARSRAAKQELLMRMWDSKVITDPEVMSELMEVPTPNILNYKAADVRLARNENLEMAKGIAVDVNSWDDHTIHLREHNAYRKTHEFMALPAEAKRIFEFHCQRHKDLQKVALAEQAELQAILQGQVTGGAAQQQEEAQPPAEQPQAGETAQSPPEEGTVES